MLRPINQNRVRRIKHLTSADTHALLQLSYNDFRLWDYLATWGAPRYSGVEGGKQAAVSDDVLDRRRARVRRILDEASQA